MPSTSAARSDNRSRFAILGALSLRPMSGYDLRQFFADNLGYFWSESYGQIYPMVRALTEQGLAEPEPGAVGRRKPFRITAAGREALASWVAAPAAPESGRIEILLKLFFASQGPADAVSAHLHRHRAEHRARLTEYEHVRVRLEREQAWHPDLRYWIATLAYGVRSSEAMLAWCDDVERLLAAAPVSAPTRV